MEVHRLLGPGFLESIYAKALCYELGARGFSTTSVFEVQVSYKGLIVGRHRLDIIVNNEVIVELKVTQGLAEAHVAQALSYMKATGLTVSLVLNFGEPSLTWKRLVR